MNKDELYHAISGINKDFIAESENFESIAANCRKKRIFSKIAVSAVPVCAIAAIGIGLWQNGAFGTDSGLTAAQAPSTDAVPSVTEITAASEQTTALLQTTTVLQTAQQKELYYRDLVKNTDLPKLEGYEDTSAARSVAGFDIEAFRENMLKDGIGIVEGEIINMKVNHYEYATASDKFQKNGALHHKESTVVYQIRVDRVLHGDFAAGEVVTVEDISFVCDPVISVKTGSRYIIPIAKGDGKLYEADQVVSGSVSMESSYYTVYPYHPQIEKVSGGYVVSSDWSSLITADCTELRMDPRENCYPFTMFHVPGAVFNERFNIIIKKQTTEPVQTAVPVATTETDMTYTTTNQTAASQPETIAVTSSRSAESANTTSAMQNTDGCYSVIAEIREPMGKEPLTISLSETETLRNKLNEMDLEAVEKPFYDDPMHIPNGGGYVVYTERGRVVLMGRNFVQIEGQYFRDNNKKADDISGWIGSLLFRYYG